MGKGTVGNWLGEICTTVGQGDLVLGGKIDESLAEFADVLENGDEVWYAIVDGNNREAGLGTLNNGVLERTNIYSVISQGVYQDNSPAALSLTGGARVFSTFNKVAFDDAIQNTQNFASENTPSIDEAKEGDTWTKTSTRQVFTYTNTGTQLHWIEGARGVTSATSPPYVVPNSNEVANASTVPGTYVTDALNDVEDQAEAAQSTADNAATAAASAQSTANQAVSDAADAVQSVSAGANVTVDNTDPQNPIVAATAAGGQVDSVVAGANITVDNTDPANPIVAASGTISTVDSVARADATAAQTTIGAGTGPAVADMGAYTASTVNDNETAKQNIEQLAQRFVDLRVDVMFFIQVEWDFGGSGIYTVYPDTPLPPGWSINTTATGKVDISYNNDTQIGVWSAVACTFNRSEIESASDYAGNVAVTDQTVSTPRILITNSNGNFGNRGFSLLVFRRETGATFP